LLASKAEFIQRDLSGNNIRNLTENVFSGLVNLHAL